MAKRALLVIDVQRIYTDKGSELYCERATTTVAKVNSLIEDAAKRGHLVVAIRHVHRKDGSDLGRMFDFSGEPEEDFNFKEETEEVEFDLSLRLPPGAVEIRKTRYSSFVGTELDSVLKARGITAVTICGFMTNFCCEATARHAHDLDYFVDFVVDATGTPGSELQTQEELRKRVADTLAVGYARTWTVAKWCKQITGPE